VKEFGENVTSYFWKKFECEICKQYYPYIFKSKDQLFKLIDITYPQNGENYILLESMPIDKNTSRMIHLLTVTPNKQEFKLGRGHESEVRINDISVSRCHAVLKYKEDGFYIEDNNSKFGTIALIRDKLHLQPYSTYAVQIGRTVISFTVRNVDVLQMKKEKQLKDQKLREMILSSGEMAPLANRVKRSAASCMRINVY
jgi:pSer/pThr/pTyr-binding forkhead associated (FHA) protein